ncbi:AraC family transcriptional regulator [Oceanobacter mangrovi]|uniref:AraC family transcriptional regulator n=1 Tax=Oceanobacter mangrovi TaxID=2862510 RepID=UPI001C8EA5CA|nr:AraC family transcriptional regulator [Oceanobacter mangrovi]
MATALLASESLHSGDYDETRQIVAERFCGHDLIPTRKNACLDYQHEFVKAGSVSLCRMQYGAEVDVCVEQLGDFFLIQIPLKGYDKQRRHNQDLISDPRKATIHQPRQPLHMHWSGDCEKLAIRIEHGYLERLSNALYGHHGQVKPQLNEAISLEDARGQAWSRQALNLFEQLSQSPDLYNNELILGQHVELLANSLLHWHATVPSYPLTTSVMPRHVRKAVDYIQAHASQPISAIQLADVSGVSVRSLYAGFREYLHTSPNRYIADTRLLRAHHDLGNPDESGNVTDIATRWGFSQLGRFSKEYFQRFGEHPRETLRRR